MTSVLVVDAGVLATALLDDATDGQAARRCLRGSQLAAPEIIDLEVVSVVRRLRAVGAVTEVRADQAIDDLTALRLERAPHRPLVARCWELRENLTPSEAAYVALAEALDAVLLTADDRLARAPGPSCRFQLLA